MVEGNARSRAAEETRRSAYAIEELTDPVAIRRILETRRPYAAYALGQLDDRFFGLVRCYQSKGSTGQALLLFSSAGLGNALFAMGDAGALEALLRLHRGPHQNYATCQPEHLPIFRRYFALAQEQPMLRMAVGAGAYTPPESPPESVIVRRLRSRDVRTLNQLYNSEGAPAYYSGTHVNEGVYYGVFDRQRLVSVAGTHVISEQWSIAVVGNVFTHPSYRGLGYARLSTGAVTADLLERCRDVVLTVDPQNTPAVRAYRRLGFHEDCQLLEAAVVRKDPLGLGSWLARGVARYRGR
ncbi:MAG TPA: GNAT family N-acetyltransferase, partial [Dehalococcoidia bacterium]|nr:GNAT family N-acetyltransferase [Dehalococcoidia bacterium]